MKNLKIFYKFIAFCMITGTLYLASACKNEFTDNTPFLGVQQEMITSYLERNSQYSTLLKVMKNLKVKEDVVKDIQIKDGVITKVTETGYTTYYELLSSYGSYTLFAPTNDAFESYFKAKNWDINNVENVVKDNSTFFRSLMEYHILLSIQKKSSFVPGLSADSTVNGDYIFIDTVGTNYVLSKRAKLPFGSADNELTNGVVHSLDKVLDPPLLTVHKYLKASGRYSIFCQALEATTLDKNLDSIYRKLDIGEDGVWEHIKYTLFAESDSVFNLAGISDLATLKTKVYQNALAVKGDARGTEDEELKNFLLYHMLSRGYWIANSSGSGSKPTLYPSERLYFTVGNDAMVLNTSPTTSIGVNVSKNYYDVMVKNGFIQEVNSVLQIPVSGAVATGLVEFDCEQGLVYNKDKGLYVYNPTVPQTVTVSPTAADLNYNVTKSTKMYSSYFESGAGLLFIPRDDDQYVTYTIRNILPGSYYVFLRYGYDASYATVQCYIDNVLFGDPIDMGISYTSETVPLVIGSRTYGSDVFSVKEIATFFGLGGKKFYDEFPLRLLGIEWTYATIATSYGTFAFQVPTAPTITFTDDGNHATSGIHDHEFKFVHKKQASGLYDQIILVPTSSYNTAYAPNGVYRISGNK